MICTSISRLLCALGNDLRVFNALVENPAQGFVKPFGNFVKVFQGQFALVELSIGEDFVDDFLHHSLNPGGRGVDERS